MKDERERIEGMLSEGRISADEAEQLLAAVEKADTRQEEEIKKPRLSRLALAGALGLPAAVVVWLLLFGFAMIWAEGPYVEDRASAGATLVALAVMLAGLGLSIGGYVAVRRAPDELRGQKLALFGIWLPAGLLAATAAMGTVTYFLLDPRRMGVEEERRAVERTWRKTKEEVFRALEEEREGEAREREDATPASPRCYAYVGEMRREVRPSEWPMQWFSPEGVDKIELRFRGQAPVPSASAVAGETSWPLAPSKDNVLVLCTTPEIRAVWQKQGGLVVQWSRGADEAGSFALRARPEAIAVDEGASVTVVQRRSKDIPGSRGYLEVKLGDITAGQVLVSIRTAEGETVVDTTSVRRGEEIPFTFGGEKYVLRVVELVNLLVGDDFGTFMVLTEGDAPGWRRIERLLALVERSDLTFIRNDKEYTPAEAAAHLRSKLRVAKTKVEIHTVEDFIDKVASRSFTTARPYLMKLPDGTTVQAREWLHERAAKLKAPQDE